eukprot:scaffold178010_cov29-Prasinocladus_malaysianus.AAC.1
MIHRPERLIKRDGCTKLHSSSMIVDIYMMRTQSLPNCPSGGDALAVNVRRADLSSNVHALMAGLIGFPKRFTWVG